MARRARDFDVEGSDCALAKRHCGFALHGQAYLSGDGYERLSSYEDMVRFWSSQENLLFLEMTGKPAFFHN